MSYKVIRTHEICAGHRVVGHESKCRHLHGHNYMFHFHVAPKMKTVAVATGKARHVEGQGFKQTYRDMTVNDRTKLDAVGRVIDFSVVKSTLCEWLELNWDHKFLHWEKDDLINGLAALAKNDQTFDEDQRDVGQKDFHHFTDSLVALPFNPTAENLAAYMVNVIGPRLLDEHDVELVQCVIEETSKCHVEYTK
ncbi:MAG: 6-pyruvoyl tetrahydrobiopterin synthase [Leifsonia xyli]|nr:MAG: 6-pyruvoyl tetrahydrobiopterin synthase [Leifsonia xyli]